MLKMVFGVLQALHPPYAIFFPGSQHPISSSASGGSNRIGINRNRTGKMNHEITKAQKKDELNFVLSSFRVFVMKSASGGAIKCKEIAIENQISFMFHPPEGRA